MSKEYDYRYIVGDNDKSEEYKYSPGEKAYLINGVVCPEHRLMSSGIDPVQYNLQEIKPSGNIIDDTGEAHPLRVWQTSKRQSRIRPALQREP